MGVISAARPDLAAHREAITVPFGQLVRDLVAVIGRKLTAYIGGVKDVRALERWIEGAGPYKNAEDRLRFAFRVVKTLENHDKPAVIQAWLTGLNPELNDRVPIRLLREGDLEKVGPEILAAVRAFVAGG
jgi:hypothetical protein